MKKGFNKLHKLICEFMVFVFVLLLFPYQAEKAGGTVKAAGFEAADTTVDISADEIISYNEWVVITYTMPSIIFALLILLVSYFNVRERI